MCAVLGFPNNMPLRRDAASHSGQVFPFRAGGDLHDHLRDCVLPLLGRHARVDAGCPRHRPSYPQLLVRPLRHLPHRQRLVYTVTEGAARPHPSPTKSKGIRQTRYLLYRGSKVSLTNKSLSSDNAAPSDPPLTSPSTPHVTPLRHPLVLGCWTGTATGWRRPSL
eukprot:1191008-Prorocentrum_minimum.AAC.2